MAVGPPVRWRGVAHRIGTIFAAVHGLGSIGSTGRAMAAAIVVNSVGSGLFLPLSAIYFTQVVGLSAAQVAAGLGIAAAVGVVSGVPFGLLADRVGSRVVLIGLLMATGLVVPFYLLVEAFWQFTLVAAVIRGLDRGISGVAAALVATVIPDPAERTQVRAVLRMASTTGLTLGAGLSAVVLSVHSNVTYTAAILVDAGSFVVAGLLYLRLPPAAGARRVGQPSALQAIKDRPYLGLTLAFSVLAMYNWAVTFALPLWALAETELSPAVISAAFVVNTAGHVLGQVPVARRVKSLERATRAAIISGLLLALACSLFALTAVGNAWTAAVLLLVAVVVNTIGGLAAASAQFYLASDLAPEEAQGQYQGLVSTGMAVSAMLAPSLFAALPLQYSGLGWGAMALIFGAAAVTVLPFSRSMARSRGISAIAQRKGAVAT
ncbi:MFS transporter [Kribbella sp. NPDC056345]|uniref:MFS transporter n=1 Tax=Kribbella sp. NPDC056345 TaxID=3345789 RepID=UPI0035D9EFF8